MNRSAGAWATLAFVLLPSLAAAQNGVIRGHVADSSRAPLAHAAVTVQGLVVRTMTGDDGAYELRGVPTGTWTVQARALGYRPGSSRVTVSAGAAVRQDFTLEAQPISVAAIDVVVGSRAQHVAADELAVPVDVFPAALLAQQGTSETGQMLQSVTPSVNFPHQSVTDATDIVRPFTLRGLSPDHTLVLLDGYRRHQMAVVNTFAYGTAAGSSGVDMNAIPSSAIDRIEVLRDGASAQYGSDAIAGVVNLVTKQGPFSPFLNAEAGEYVTKGYAADGRSADVNGGVGFGLGRGSFALFGEYQDRQPTNRAWADPYDPGALGVTDSVNASGKVVVKRNTVPQPNQHWGDGLERDLMTLANLHLPLNASGTTALFGMASYSYRVGTGFGYRRYASSDRNWPQIYPVGFLPQYHPQVVDYSGTAGIRGAFRGWAVEAGGTYGHNNFKYNLENTLNQSLGPSLSLAIYDTVGIPNQTSFFAGRLARDEFSSGLTASRSVDLGLPAPVSVATGVAFRWERFLIGAGERASWINGGDTTQSGGDPIPGSQVFPGFSPSDASTHTRTNVGAFADLETNLTRRFLANVAARFEHYSDFGSRLTGKLALRFQPSERVTLRAAASTGFRAPGLGQEYFSKVITNVIAGVTQDIGVFPVDHPASRALGSKPLRDETSQNLSAGVAVTPWANFTVTADYFYILLKHRIVLGATLNDDSSLAILSRAGYPNIAGVQYFTNGIDTRTQGVDLNANLRVPDVAGGSLDLTAAVNYTNNKIVHVDPRPSVLQFSPHGLLDTVTTLAIERERPDWRGTLTAQYTYGAIHGLVRGSYYGSFRSAQPGYCDQCGEFYGGRTLVDVELGYRLGAADLSVGVRNLFDVYPAQPHTLTPIVAGDPSQGTAKDYNSNYATFPWAAASPFGYNGRNLYTRLRLTLP